MNGWEGWEQPGYASTRAPATPATESPPPTYASWGRRLAAVVLDSIFIVGAMLAVLVVLALVAAGVGAEEDDDWLVAIVAVIVLAGPFVYYTVMIGTRGQSFGKKMLRVAVRDADAPDRMIGHGRAFGRYFLATLFWLLLYLPGILDSLWPLWDRRKQSWHDKIVRSVVIRV